MIGPSVGDAKSLRSVKRVNSKNAKILCKHYQMLTYFARISITVQLTYWFGFNQTIKSVGNFTTGKATESKTVQ